MPQRLNILLIHTAPRGIGLIYCAIHLKQNSLNNMRKICWKGRNKHAHLIVFKIYYNV